MATTYHNDLQKLYVAYFNRPADVAGLNYWEGVVEAANGSTAAVSAAFAASAEYKATYAGLNTAAIINAIYNNLFGRDAEAAGSDYWVAGITAGNFTIDQAVTVIGQAALDAPSGADKVAFTSKLAAANAFTAALDTQAEADGYNGDAANALAKTWLKGITTAESLAAATAPATLAAGVAAVVKAGTPFTLSGALSTLAAAEDARADFLAAADGDNDADTAETDITLAADVTAAATALNTPIPGFLIETSEGVRAVRISDTAKALAATVTTTTKAHVDALAAAGKVAGLAGALTAAASAQASSEAAAKAVTSAQTQLAGAEAIYEAKQAAVTINANGTVTGVIEFNSSGKLVVDDAIVDADKKADAAALLTAVQARETADASAAAAATQAYYAQIQADLLDTTGAAATEQAAVATGMTLVNEKVAGKPTPSEIVSELAGLNAKAAAARVKANGDAAFEADAVAAEDAVADFEALVDAYLTADADVLGDAVTGAAADLKAATDAVASFNKLVTAYTAAQANVTQLETLDAAIESALETFTDADISAPVTLLAFNVATADANIFLADAELAESTIVNFGDQGDDALFIGTEYTLNTSTTVANGNNAILEVFFIQNGADVEVHLETEAVGSASTALAENVITLTGVTVAELTLSNGIITA